MATGKLADKREKKRKPAMKNGISVPKRAGRTGWPGKFAVGRGGESGKNPNGGALSLI
jgi:hypothetical protein